MKYLFCPNIRLSDNKFLCLETSGTRATPMALPEDVLESFFDLEEQQKHSGQTGASAAGLGRVECMPLNPSEVVEKCESSRELDHVWVTLATFCVGLCSNLTKIKYINNLHL